MKDTALLLIDPLNDFLAEGGKLWPYAKDVIHRLGMLDNLRNLLGTARAAGITVVFVPHRRYEPGTFTSWKFLNPTHAGVVRIESFLRGSWGAEFHPDFTPRAGELVASEHWLHSGFMNTDLDLQLRMHGIDRIVIAGMRTNACVEATARWGVELGYHVTLAKDATAAFSIEEWQATIEVNARTYAHSVATSEEIVARWASAAATPQIAPSQCAIGSGVSMVATG
jgi:nicotinamidase-related amidase